MTTARRFPCPHSCRGGHDCVCERVYGQAHHTHHICDDPACICHAAEAYGLALTSRGGVLLYAAAPERLEAQP